MYFVVMSFEYPNPKLQPFLAFMFTFDNLYTTKDRRELFKAKQI